MKNFWAKIEEISVKPSKYRSYAGGVSFSDHQLVPENYLRESF